jgi:hypothetical protein
MVLLIRGGGIAAGVHATTSYATLLSDLLRLHGIDVINRSRDRDTTFQACWSFEEDIAPYQPNFVLFHFCIDDIYRPVYRSEFKENLVQLVRLCRVRYNATMFLATAHPFSNDFEMLSALIYYRTIREVAIDLNCHYIPIHYLIADELAEHSLVMKDIVHTDERYINDIGHRLFFNIISRKVLSAISAV